MTWTRCVPWAPRVESSRPRSPDPVVELPSVARRDRLALGVQRAMGRLTGLVWAPLVIGVMYFVYGWRITDVAAIRRRYQELRRDGGPLIVCANHLTMIDSFLVAWALGSPWWYIAHWSALPWNVPERRNFAATPLAQGLVYLMKCLPITRGGDRGEAGAVLTRIAFLVDRGEVALLFPEGGRSRTGRVEVERAAYGVGRLVAMLPGCRVLCVYLRGGRQDGYSDLPGRGETFHVQLDCVEPRSEQKGLRRAVDLARQITARLAVMEREHLAERA